MHAKKAYTCLPNRCMLSRCMKTLVSVEAQLSGSFPFWPVACIDVPCRFRCLCFVALIQSGKCPYSCHALAASTVLLAEHATSTVWQLFSVRCFSSAAWPSVSIGFSPVPHPLLLRTAGGAGAMGDTGPQREPGVQGESVVQNVKGDTDKQAAFRPPIMRPKCSLFWIWVS